MFLATHDYVILKELELGRRPTDQLSYHSFYRESDDEGVRCSTSDAYASIQPNAIQETFLGLYDRQVEQDFRS